MKTSWLFWRRRPTWGLSPGQIVQHDGKLYTIERIEWPSGQVTLAGIDAVLAWRLITRRNGEPVRVGDALIDAGWTPPSD